uniref:FYVE-type domain-containing protein n=1 Tax=Caenorhabditis japonica TaxID=281687 RepID=A0A8R1INJ6_CAEJA
MPASICCTNCRTKYSILNREAGCSSCALSFCKKCLGYRAIIPTLSEQPMIVCYNCYQKLEAAKIKPEVFITSTPLPNAPRPGGSNWWGDGLPPPSFRQTYNGNNPTRSIPQSRPNASQLPQVSTQDLEQRREKLRQDINQAPVEPLSLEEIEERLARLRGCDVEQIRNPKSVSLRETIFALTQ